MTAPSQIFDRELLHERRRRLVMQLQSGGPDNLELPDFLLSHAAEDVVDRLSMVQRSFARAITIGSYHGLVAHCIGSAGVRSIVATDPVADILALCQHDVSLETIVADEETLPLASPLEAGSFDLALAVLSLQYINDLPGTLTRILRLLQPDGLFVGILLGGSTLTELRQTMLAAEAEVLGGASPRVMPFVDVRDAGSLLQRAGFALPVTDTETLTVTYASALDLMRELRAMGATNVLHERSRVPLTRGVLLRAAEIYAERFPAEDGAGRVRATFEFITLTGWSPDPSQQKPLKPGSAQVSLTEILKPRDGDD